MGVLLLEERAHSRIELVKATVGRVDNREEPLAVCLEEACGFCDVKAAESLEGDAQILLVLKRLVCTVPR